MLQQSGAWQNSFLRTCRANRLRALRTLWKSETDLRHNCYTVVSSATPEEPPLTGLPEGHHQRSMDPCPTDKQRDPEGLLGMDAAVAAGVPPAWPLCPLRLKRKQNLKIFANGRDRWALGERRAL